MLSKTLRKIDRGGKRQRSSCLASDWMMMTLETTGPTTRSRSWMRRTVHELSRSLQARTRSRSLVRTPSHPKTPPRRTAAEKVAFLEWLTSESCITEAADQFDCGCGLYEEGCYNRLVVTLMARKELATLMKPRRVRFSHALAKLKPRALVELRNACVSVDGSDDGSAFYFEFTVHKAKVRLCSHCSVKEKSHNTTQNRTTQHKSHNTNREENNKRDMY